MPNSPNALTWSQLHLPRPLDVAAARALLAAWASDRDARRIVLEVRADEHGVRYLLGARATEVRAVQTTLEHLLPGTTLTGMPHPRLPVSRAGGLRLSPAGLALSTEHPEEVTTAILSAAAHRLRGGETVVLQMVLGPRLAPAHTRAAPADPHQSLLNVLVDGVKPAPRPVAAQIADRRRPGRVPVRAASRCGQSRHGPRAAVHHRAVQRRLNRATARGASDTAPRKPRPDGRRLVAATMAAAPVDPRSAHRDRMAVRHR